MNPADSRFQRIALHLRCLRRRPLHLPFHAKGIAREFQASDLAELAIYAAIAIAAQCLAFRLV